MPHPNDTSTVVLASGVFDLLHLGHVKFLEAAKAVGGKKAKLVVVIARDRTVEKIKNGKPIMPEDQRLALVQSLKIVNRAILGQETLDLENIIQAVKPDIIALGYDQIEMEKRVNDYIKSHGMKIIVVRIEKFLAEELDSSSKIKQKIMEKSSK